MFDFNVNVLYVLNMLVKPHALKTYKLFKAKKVGGKAYKRELGALSTYMHALNAHEVRRRILG